MPENSLVQFCCCFFCTKNAIRIVRSIHKLDEQFIFNLERETNLTTSHAHLLTQSLNSASYFSYARMVAKNSITLNDKKDPTFYEVMLKLLFLYHESAIEVEENGKMVIWSVCPK